MRPWLHTFVSIALGAIAAGIARQVWHDNLITLIAGAVVVALYWVIVGIVTGKIDPSNLDLDIDFD